MKQVLRLLFFLTLAYALFVGGAHLAGRRELVERFNVSVSDGVFALGQGALRMGKNFLSTKMNEFSVLQNALAQTSDQMQSQEVVMKSLLSLLGGAILFVLLRGMIAGIAMYQPKSTSGDELRKYLRRITLSKFVKVVVVSIVFYTASRYVASGKLDIRWLCIVLECAILGMTAAFVMRLIRGGWSWVSLKLRKQPSLVSVVLDSAGFKGVWKKIAQFTIGRPLTNFYKWAVSLLAEKYSTQNQEQMREDDYQRRKNERSLIHKAWDKIGACFGKAPSVQYKALTPEQIADCEARARQNAERTMNEEISSLKSNIWTQIVIGCTAPVLYLLLIKFAIDPIMIKLTGVTFEYYAKRQIIEAVQLAATLL